MFNTFGDKFGAGWNKYGNMATTAFDNKFAGSLGFGARSEIGNAGRFLSQAGIGRGIARGGAALGGALLLGGAMGAVGSGSIMGGAGGAVGGGMKGSILGAMVGGAGGAGYGFFTQKGAGSMAFKGARRGAWAGLALGAGYGAIKQGLMGNRPLNPINGLYH